MQHEKLRGLARKIEDRLPGVLVRSRNPLITEIIVEPFQWPAWLFNFLSVVVALTLESLCVWVHVNAIGGPWEHMLAAVAFDIPLLGIISALSVSLVKCMRARVFVVDHKDGTVEMRHLPLVRTTFKLQEIKVVFAATWHTHGRPHGDICISLSRKKRLVRILDLKQLSAPWNSRGRLRDELCEAARLLSDVLQCPVGDARRLVRLQKWLL